jgi:DNA-binding transcriptional LysR family regulator
MEYRHLRFFVAVAEELHFTKAATRLHVAQPHLSQEIRRLEKELGVTLFERDRRRVMLTAAGRAFLVRAQMLLADTSAAVRAAQRANRGETGTLRIGFVSSAGLGIVLPDAVRRFRTERPEVEVLLSEQNSDEQVDLITRRRLDVGLLHPPLKSELGLEIEIVSNEPLVAALPGNHPLAASRSIQLRALGNEPWILFPRGIASRLYEEIMIACAGAGFSPRVVQEGIKLSTIMSLVASGLGVSLVPQSLGRIGLRRVTCVPLAEKGPTLPLALIWRRGDANPTLPPFMQIVRKVAASAHQADKPGRRISRPAVSPARQVRKKLAT